MSADQDAAIFDRIRRQQREVDRFNRIVAEGESALRLARKRRDEERAKLNDLLQELVSPSPVPLFDRVEPSGNTG